LGLRKILWHKGFDDAQLGIFAKRAHVIFQEARDVVWGHVNGVLVSDGRSVTASGFATFGTVRYFLAADTGLVSLDFTIEAFVFIHKLLLFGIRMCLSHSIGVDVHGVSSLGSGSWSGSSVSSILVVFPLVWL